MEGKKEVEWYSIIASFMCCSAEISTADVVASRGLFLRRSMSRKLPASASYLVVLEEEQFIWVKRDGRVPSILSP